MRELKAHAFFYRRLLPTDTRLVIDRPSEGKPQQSLMRWDLETETGPIEFHVVVSKYVSTRKFDSYISYSHLRIPSA